MPITNSVKNAAPAIGAGNFYASNLAQTTSPIQVPATPGTLTPQASNGKIRVKITPAAGGTGQVGTITGTDGTTTLAIYPGDSAAGAANAVVERMVEFISDLKLTSITVTVTAAGGTTDAEMIYSV